jgi:GNAT superfamily N-acetyltransferase
MADFVPAPDVKHGWLTLHWPSNDITTFLSSKGCPSSSIVETQHADDIRAVFVSTLAAAATENNNPSLFRLRLATEQDLDAMYRLVNGLAVYEKEADAVHVTKDHYRCDGFSTTHPLFYCVLLDSGDSSSSSSSYTCGMAFCYVARNKDGLFLYLEDLFIEEDYRGGGAGMMVMKALASVAISLGCSKMIWQALDWNTPALNFYKKLGAKVVEGLITARYAGEDLKAFAVVDSSG